jgi:hypothetical protein
VSSPTESTELTADRGAADSGGAVSIACASCRRLVAADGPCPHCGWAPTSAPRVPADPTVVLPPVPAETAELEVVPADADGPNEPDDADQPDAERWDAVEQRTDRWHGDAADGERWQGDAADAESPIAAWLFAERPSKDQAPAERLGGLPPTSWDPPGPPAASPAATSPGWEPSRLSSPPSSAPGSSPGQYLPSEYLPSEYLPSEYLSSEPPQPGGAVERTRSRRGGALVAGAAALVLVSAAAVAGLRTSRRRPARSR